MGRQLTVKEISEKLGVDHKTIRRWIKKGELQAELVNGRYLIDEDNLTGKEFTQETTQVGNQGVTSKPTLDHPELLQQLQSENEYLRQELSKAHEELSMVRQRSDSIIMQLTRQVEQSQLLLEDLRPKPKQKELKKPWWRKLFGERNKDDLAARLSRSS